MDRLFRRIGTLIEDHPIKVLLVTLFLFILLATGVSQVRLATGNETLVPSDSEAFLSNKAMEETFGGDSVLILFQDNPGGSALSLENITKMWNLEKRFQYEENITSFMSPATIVHQMAEKQGAVLKDKVSELSGGLAEMGTRMTDLGTELGAKNLPDPLVLKAKLDSLSSATAGFDRLIQGQDKMSEGAKALQGGLSATAGGLGQASAQLLQLSSLAGENMELKMKLTAISESLGKSAQGIRTMGENTTGIQEGTKNTSDALSSIKSKLKKETSSMADTFSGGISPDELKEMAAGFTAMGANLTEISGALETFHSKSGMMVADIPTDQTELDLLLHDETGALRPVFSDVVMDGGSSLMVVRLAGNLDDTEKERIAGGLRSALEKESFTSVSAIVSGKPVLDISLRAEMKTNMMKMVAAAVVIMLLVLLAVFRVRWRMLSLGMILISVVATLGLMSYLSVPITMVSMAVFPILIGLGIDYSIQFHNRYEEERSIRGTMQHVGKAVAIAVLATVLGFASLYASPVPMIQDFGKMLTIGVIVSFIGSVFLLLPILRLRDRDSLAHPERKPVLPKGSIHESRTTLLDRGLAMVTKGVIQLRYPILILVVVLGVLGFLADGKVGVETDIESFMPQEMGALQDIRTVRDTKGSTDQMVLYLKDEDVLSEENLDWIRTRTEKLESSYPDTIVDVKSIDSIVKNLSTEELTHDGFLTAVSDLPEKQAGMFVNAERTEGVILLNITHLSTEDLRSFVSELKAEAADSPMEVTVTGKSVLDVEMVDGLTSGRIRMTGIGLALVFLALLLIYRNLVKALLPIFPVALIIGFSGGIMFLLGLEYTPITSTLGALVLGMGTEMTIMLMERYLEERNSGQERLDAMTRAVTSIGKAIVASGLTTVGGFSVLMLSDFVILKDFGLMTVINISLALLSTFLILPPALYLLDRFLVKRKDQDLEDAALEEKGA
ncbi:MAG TPA: hydrophobe/amphiphile efflux-3 (HAE3) family transporter [Clostridiaceae bacterium]|nr:hydrophobe/amphiphile efflux-3 (HAE3) family transporter [Clostridiaceae bacterium]